MSKNLPLGGRWPEGPEGESLAFARNLRAYVKLSPTACGRSPLPEGAKEFFDSLGFPLGGKAKKLKNVRFLVKTPLPNFLHNDIILKR